MGTKTQSESQPPSIASTIQLLFLPSHRPAIADLHAAEESLLALSISASGDQDSDTSLQWAELIWNGLSYRLLGIAPGTGAVAALPPGTDVHGNSIALMEAVDIVAGPHLAGAENSIPIVKALWNMVGGLVETLPHCEMIVWQHSSVALVPQIFREMAADWESKLLHPISGLVQFADEIDLGMKTRGLAFFTGQELRIEPELTNDRDWARRLGMRLADTLIARGNLSEVEEFTGPDGSRLRLTPSQNGKFVRVWRS